MNVEGGEGGGVRDGGGGEGGSEIDAIVETGKAKPAEPPKYAVWLHNDDYTTMEFVVEVLRKFFAKTEEDAARVMLKVHHEGKGVAGVYSFEIAETKASQVKDYAKSKGHPLLCSVEPA